MTTFSTIDYAIFAAYLAAMVVVGELFAKRQKSLGEYFHASGSIPW